jgi:hypothetical protein
MYTADRPFIDGLGMAGIRDLISFLKYGGNETMLNNQRRFMKRAIGFGTSQSGRWLRSFLYDGFNADEKGRKVFDGLWAHVAGAGRGSFNHRFASPTVAGNSVTSLLYPVDLFPFSDIEQTDPELGLKDGLLSRAVESRVVPKIFYTNSSVEYYARVASLTTTTLDSTADVPLGRDTRMYFITGTQHGPSPFPPGPGLQHKRNPGEYRWALRALLVAMQDWLKFGKEPPPSQFPRIADGNLVPLKEVRFPEIPHASFPSFYPPIYRLDFGPKFRSKRLVTKQPPSVGKPYRLLFPQVDSDGNEKAGIRLPHIRVPLATYTGWNFEAVPLGKAEVLAGLSGSWLPFAATKKERVASNDPRPSVAERYPSKEAYLKRVEEAVNQLASERYVLAQDLDAILFAAEREWDYVTAQ